MIALWILTSVLALAAVATVGFLVWPLRHPLPTESDYSHHSSPWWQMYYAHKYLRPMARPERGSGLESHFRNQDFRFEREPLRNRRQLRITATGDLMFRRDIAGAGGRVLWEEVGPAVFDSDLSIGNLEFAVNADWVIEKTLRFSVPPHFADPLVADGERGQFDVLSLANNHINDSLSDGIRKTLEYVEGKGIVGVGAARSPSEREEVHIVERQGVKIAILAYTFSTNNIPLDAGFQFGTNLVRFNALDERDYDESLIVRHIARAKELGAEMIICCNHWGLDLEFYPPKRIVDRAHRLLELGVDLIVGHHPHVVGPAERVRTRDGRDGLIFYSLGNLTSRGLIFPVQRFSLVLQLDVEVGLDDAGARVVRPCKVGLVPVYHAKHWTTGGLLNRLIAVRPALASIAAGTPQASLRRGEIRHLPRLWREYQSRFLAEGVEYR